MPLRQAVFAFSMAEDTEIVEIGATPLPELAKILEDKSGACKAEIDPTGLVFLFHFYANRATIISGGAPWAILEQPRETTFNPDPQLEAEALFNKEEFVKGGFVNLSISDEKAARLSKRDRAIREATGLVWRQYMLHSFDRAGRPLRAHADSRRRFRATNLLDWPVDRPTRRKERANRAHPCPPRSVDR